MILYDTSIACKQCVKIMKLNEGSQGYLREGAVAPEMFRLLLSNIMALATLLSKICQFNLNDLIHSEMVFD